MDINGSWTFFVLLSIVKRKFTWVVWQLVFPYVYPFCNEGCLLPTQPGYPWYLAPEHLMPSWRPVGLLSTQLLLQDLSCSPGSCLIQQILRHSLVQSKSLEKKKYKGCTGLIDWQLWFLSYTVQHKVCKNSQMLNRYYLEVVFACTSKRIANRISTCFQNCLSHLSPLNGRNFKLVRVIHFKNCRRYTFIYDEPKRRHFCT